MYVQALPLAEDRTQAYFHHAGGAFIETIYFWGLPNVNDFGWIIKVPIAKRVDALPHARGLEVVAQMLDRRDYTEDAAFARNSLLPMAEPRSLIMTSIGSAARTERFRLDPAQAIENLSE